jgi:UDPglucose 6-dehydrogenase
VPARIPADSEFWYVLGLYVAEGCVAADGRRQRITWSIHHSDEFELVDAVSAYWAGLGVKHDVREKTTSTEVTVSSVLLAALIEHVLEVGRDCYTKRVPDEIWNAAESSKWMLLRGLWDGDGSWSLVNRGPSRILDYGTVSHALADGMLRLLGDVGIVASIRVGRTSKSTCDTYWLRISGAEQIEQAGYRRLDDKAVAWVPVTGVDATPWQGTVYSLEVDRAHTIVTTGGLVAHNCFPKDTRALIHMADDRGYAFDLLRSVVAVNDEQYERVAEKIAFAAGGSLQDKTIAVWGLTFKARTDDTRESPSLFVIDRLRARGATVRAFDPMVHRQLEGITVCDDAYAAAEGASALAVLTEWDEFRFLDMAKVRSLMVGANIVDARNLLDPAAVRRHGFTYDAIGRL